MPPHPSISPSFNTISPKPPAPDPNLNPFSPLSPDLPENTLSHRNGDDEVTRLLGLSSPRKKLIIYTRRELLLLGKSSRQRGPPSGMGGLDTWFGPTSKANVQHVDDPAIASIGPPSNSSRRTGFGEGFGFGGGIGGGKGINGRGGRNIGLRRQPETSLDSNGLPLDNRSYGGQMGRFSVKNPGNSNIRLGADEVGLSGKNLADSQIKKESREWRRPDRDFNGRHTRDGRNARGNFEEDNSEPAWMDDSTPADPAIVDDADPLVQFTPGEDMIAAHKRAMKARDVGADWRGEANLPSFFGGDPAIASSSAPLPPPGMKPKSFNAADYLKQAEEIADEDVAPQLAPPPPPTSAFSSRFQKFFSPTQEAPVEPPPVVEVGSDRTTKLMGLLSSKTSPPPVQNYAPSPNDQLRHLSSPPIPDISSSHPSPNFYGNSGGPSPPPPSHANALLQQLYGNSQERQLPPDPLQLLNQAQRQGYQRPPHMSLPPQFVRPPPTMYSQDESAPDIHSGYPPFGRQHPFPGGPPPGFMPPPPPFYQQGPPRPPGYPVPNFPPQQAPPPRPYSPLGPAQQDMLATLFSSLGGHRN